MLAHYLKVEGRTPKVYFSIFVILVRNFSGLIILRKTLLVFNEQALLALYKKIYSVFFNTRNLI